MTLNDDLAPLAALVPTAVVGGMLFEMGYACEHTMKVIVAKLWGFLRLVKR